MDPDRDRPSPDSDARAAASLGEALAGRYAFEELVGRGGMANVFRARDLKHGRDVAIKILHAWAGESLDAERFDREVRIVASLMHPHIIPLYDSGRAGETLYYVMPYLAGGTLAQQLAREGRLSVDVAARLAREIADALDHAHRHGLVHRDVKPQNILLSEMHALVSDFGLARLLEDSAGRRSTPSSTRLGTPLYMSPEQVGGRRVDARADQYSLACVLYEMLVGEPPFTSTQLEALIYQHRGVDPRPVRERRPEIPAHLARALHRALAKMPEDRFASMAEFGAALRDEPEVALAAPATNGAVHLPSEPRSFIGRENELWECVGLLARSRVLTLTGPGGCGKTRLALELAGRTAVDHPGGTWFVDLAGTDDPDRVELRVAETVGVREASGSNLPAAMSRAFGEEPALLVLDNCEHLLAACAALASQLVRTCPGLHMLATSREPLHVAGEQVYPVPPLALPAPDTKPDRETLLGFDAVRLFLERSRAVSPGFDPHSEDLAAVAEICTRLDGLPLAIELAAARMRMLTAPELLARMQDRFRLLTGQEVGTPERHRTLHAAVGWSHDLLAEPERVALRGLAVFRGGWTLASATAVCDPQGDDIRMLDVLTRLADRSLVVVLPAVDGTSRYRLLETVREYALERLREAGEANTVAARHVDYFLRLAETAFERFLSPEQGRWLRLLQQEQENLLAALDRCAARPDGGPRGLQLASALYRHWYTHGLYAIGRQALERALAHPGAQEPTAMRARALFSLAGLAEMQGDTGPARAGFEGALAIFRERGDRLGTAKTLMGLAGLEARARRFERAHEHNRSSLAIYRELDAAPSIAYVLYHEADVSLRECRPGEAVPLLEEAMSLARQTDNRALLAWVLTARGIAALQMHEPEGARAALAAALRLAHQQDARNTAADGLRACVALALDHGDAQLAARWLGAALALHRAHGTGDEEVPGVQRAALRDRIDASGLAVATREAALREGEGLPFDSAVRTAIEWLESSAGR